MKFSKLIIFILLTTLGHASDRCSNLLINFSFDWDDNIIYMPTNIVLLNKKNNQTKLLTTEEFAKHRSEFGVPGTAFEDYYVDAAKSFVRFKSFDEKNYFLEDVKNAFTTGAKFAPSWPFFEHAMNDKFLASQTTIITARGHSREHMMEGLVWLKENGYIKYTPKIENIWAITSSSFQNNYLKSFNQFVEAASPEDPSKAKADVIDKILDDINTREFTKKNLRVLSPDGHHYGNYHLWGFSDDDYKNFKMARDHIQKGLDRGRWAKTKITLFYTGHSNPRVTPYAIVLRPKKAPREFLEKKEWKVLLNKM